MPGALSYAVQIGIDILGTYLGSSATSQTGTILASIGDVTKEFADSSNCEWWQHVGLASRPSSPIGGASACQGIALRQADRDVVICSRDVRTNQIYGNLGPGETCLFAAGGDGKSQGRVIIKDDGSTTIFTTDDNTASGNAVYLMVHPTMGLQFVAEWGSLKFDQTGFHVKHASGAGFDLGAVGGLPGPFSALGSYITMKAGTIKANAPQVYLGTELAYGVVAYGLTTNPLTIPMVPVSPVGFGVPCGLITCNSVRVGII